MTGLQKVVDETAGESAWGLDEIEMGVFLIDLELAEWERLYRRDPCWNPETRQVV